MIPWSHPSPRPKRHLERFSRSCTAHGCDPQTDTQMHRPRYICSNRPHLARLLRCGLISRPTAELTKSLSYEHKQLSHIHLTILISASPPRRCKLATSFIQQDAEISRVFRIIRQETQLSQRPRDRTYDVSARKIALETGK